MVVFPEMTVLGKYGVKTSEEANMHNHLDRVSPVQRNVKG
jgi:hypothetical protein